MNYQLTPVTKGDTLLTVYTTVDDLTAQAPRQIPKGPGGRPCVMSDSELIAALLYAVGVAGTKTLKAAYNLTNNSHRREFPTLPTYEGFVAHCHRVMPTLWWILGRLMTPERTTERFRLLDATKLPACKDIRAKGHRVLHGLAAWGKTSQGWFFGLKLHLAVTERGVLRVAILTPGNVSDRTPLEPLLEDFEGAGIGDGGYLVNQADHHALFDRKIWLLTGVRKNMRRLMAPWQHQLLKVRQRVEGVFDYLKEHLHLVSSFPRSVPGVLLHIMLVLLAYQVHMVHGVF